MENLFCGQHLERGGGGKQPVDCHLPGDRGLGLVTHYPGASECKAKCNADGLLRLEL